MLCMHDAVVYLVLMYTSLEEVNRKTGELLHEFRSEDLLYVKEIILSIL